jgi:hypothetical protein
MITSLILYAIYGAIWVLTSPIRLLPDASLSSSISSAITTISGYIAAMYSVLPTTTVTLISLITIVITLETAVLTYKGIMWIIRKIPGIS